jgi:RNA polymerase-binding transcription factor DksA
MRSTGKFPMRLLAREAREIRQRVSALRRKRQPHVVLPDVPEDGSLRVFDAALDASVEQQEVVWRRLSEKSRALAEAQDQVRQGRYEFCRACGCRIPRRRLEAMPTATLCVPCQEKREAAHTASGPG